MGQRRRARPAQHPGDLGDAGLAGYGQERGLRAGIPDLLADKELCTCCGRHLGRWVMQRT